jgi:quercetin dioxygenase-like cupin family protein
MRAAAIVLALVLAPPAPAAAQRPAVIQALEQTLPRLDREQVTVRVLQVVYPPGGESAAHRHPCPVVGYVAAGRIRVEIEGSPSAILAAGQSFYEPRGAAHLVSANASDREPATLIAFFLCDNDHPLSIPIRP